MVLEILLKWCSMVIFQDKLENQEEKIVAAKNEENAKVSAVQPVKDEKSENEPPPTVIEKPMIPQVTLRHSYKEGSLSSFCKLHSFNVKFCFRVKERLIFLYWVYHPGKMLKNSLLPCMIFGCNKNYVYGK